MKITPSPLTISQLLSSNNEQFLVPAYQRRYAWADRQLGELFDDINLLKENDTHLLSTIVFLTDNHTAGINSLEIVDGQQRLTSITILLKVLQQKFKDIDQNKNHEKINSYLKCEGYDGAKRNKLLLGELDNPDYEIVMEGNFSEDDVVNKNLVNAYNKFSQWLDEHTSDINIFYYKLINSLMVIRLDVGQAKDAYKLFETINNRGLKLSPTDIIKNFLLGHASIWGDVNSKQVRQYWQDVIINLDGINTDDFFRQWLSGTLKRKVSVSKLIDEFKSYYMENVKEAEALSTYHLYEDVESNSEDGDELVTTEIDSEQISIKSNKVKKISINEFAAKLKNASHIYSKIINRSFDNNEINKSLFNLTRIRSFPSYIFLLNLFSRDLSDKVKLQILKMIQSFMLRRHICEYRTGEFDDIFSKLVDVKDEDIENIICVNLKKIFPPDIEFEEKLSRYNFKGNIDRAKYMLELYEYDLIIDKGEYSINSGSLVHLEHIIPVVIDTKKAKRELGDWVEYLGEKALEKHSMYVNMIGNFSILGSELNIIASNNPFLAKVKEYKKSNLQLSKNLTRYSTFKFKQVEERSKELARIGVTIWTL